VSTKTRLETLEQFDGEDLVLYDAAGKILWAWRGDVGIATLGLMRAVEAGDPEITEILRRTHHASWNFGRLWQIPAAMIDEPDCSENENVGSAGERIH
jgi:hypothetical protein